MRLPIRRSGEVVATGRLLPDGHIGRMAVLKEWRGKGVGGAILQRLIAAREPRRPGRSSCSRRRMRWSSIAATDSSSAARSSRSRDPAPGDAPGAVAQAFFLSRARWPNLSKAFYTPCSQTARLANAYPCEHLSMRFRTSLLLFALATGLPLVLFCDSCYGL
jgi:GNAT superfamily N-acetyltransferase